MIATSGLSMKNHDILKRDRQQATFNNKKLATSNVECLSQNVELILQHTIAADE